MRPVCLFTDFGAAGPYVGQMKIALHKAQPGLTVFDLMADAPAFDPRSAAYLLAALLPYTPEDAVILGVVDPGVGGPRHPMVAKVDDRYLVGPDNGLFAIAYRRAQQATAWPVLWRPPTLSSSFHGRDLFAPVAAGLADKAPTTLGRPMTQIVGADWPDDLDQVVYVDCYGNAITGRRAATLGATATVRVGGTALPCAGTFGAVPTGSGFWYENSIGLVEIAVNQGRADQFFGLKIGTSIV